MEKATKGGSAWAILRGRAEADEALAGYVLSLREQYRSHELPLEMVRHVLDQATGTQSLTQLLYESRERPM